MPHHRQVTFNTWLQQNDSLGHCIGSWCKKETDQTANCFICQKVFNIQTKELD